MIDGDDLANCPVREHLFAPTENSQLQGRWVDAVDLRAGDTLFLQGSGPTPIESVLLKPVNNSVYNFAVDELKCYAVGQHSVLVLNSNGLELPLPTMKASDYGLKIADKVPPSVPRDWSREAIEDAIIDYQTSIASRKAEQAAFALAGNGTFGQALTHAERIIAEEGFLRALSRALEKLN